MLELLAPAQNKECAIAAINYGADAIYIGAQSFGARRKAGNSIEDIKEIVDYAHKFYVRVYVTINTILTDGEVMEAKKLIYELYKIGVDAIIIQDMGLLELDLPQIPVFASTQCDNRTLEKVKFLENVGFSRVILARELSLEQIGEICKNTDVEIETFIHGALCVSYSGQCYMSYANGGRSANRGGCAQPCRKKYTLTDEDGKIIAKDKYLLSLKDFSAAAHIKKLAEAGVTSFKIEGRLKGVEYVKNVVGFYRQLIDDFAKKTSSGKVFLDFEPDIEKSFNRGYTDYSLSCPPVRGKVVRRTGRGVRSETKDDKCIYNFDTPKSIGKKVGKVTKVGKNYFEYSGEALNPQDGLCYFENGELKGFLVNKVEGNKIYPAISRLPDKLCCTNAPSKNTPLSPFGHFPPQGAQEKASQMPNVQTILFRNQDVKFEKQLANSKTCRKIAVNFTVCDDKIIAVDEDKNSVTLAYKSEEQAKNPEKMRDTFTAQLKKTGESDFYVEHIEVNSEKLPFLTVSGINDLRRKILEMLMAERLKNYKRLTQKPLKKAQFVKQNLNYTANVHNKYAQRFYENCGCCVEEKSLESGKNTSGKVLMTTKHCLKRAFNLCGSDKKLFLIDEQGKKYALIFNCQACEMEIKHDTITKC